MEISDRYFIELATAFARGRLCDPTATIEDGKRARTQAQTNTPELSPPPDPFTTLREQREKKKAGFDHDPFSVNKKLID